MAEPSTTLALILGTVTTLGGAAFGWLRGKSETDKTVSESESKQLEVLTGLVKSQGAAVEAAHTRAEKQSARISALSAQLDELASRLRTSEDDRDDLRADLAELAAKLETRNEELQAATDRISELEAHVETLQGQIRALNHEPAPAPQSPKKPVSKTRGKR